jgi:hypothetical protein
MAGLLILRKRQIDFDLAWGLARHAIERLLDP